MVTHTVIPTIMTIATNTAIDSRYRRKATVQHKEKTMTKFNLIKTSAVLATLAPVPALAHVDSMPHVHEYVWAGLAVAAAIAAVLWAVYVNEDK